MLVYLNPNQECYETEGFLIYTRILNNREVKEIEDQGYKIRFVDYENSKTVFGAIEQWVYNPLLTKKGVKEWSIKADHI